MLDRLWRSVAAKSRQAFWRGAPIDVHEAEEKMRTEEGVKELVGMLNMFTTPLPGSPKQKGMDLSDLEAMLAQCDDEGLKAALFVTHTCPAAKHELCQHLIRQYGGIGRLPAVAEEVVEDVVTWERDANTNAFIVAYYAELRLTFIVGLLGATCAHCARAHA